MFWQKLIVKGDDFNLTHTLPIGKTEIVIDLDLVQRIRFEVDSFRILPHETPSEIVRLYEITKNTARYFSVESNGLILNLSQVRHMYLYLNIQTKENQPIEIIYRYK